MSRQFQQSSVSRFEESWRLRRELLTLLTEREDARHHFFDRERKIEELAKKSPENAEIVRRLSKLSSFSPLEPTRMDIKKTSYLEAPKEPTVKLTEVIGASAGLSKSKKRRLKELAKKKKTLEPEAELSRAQKRTRATTPGAEPESPPQKALLVESSGQEPEQEEKNLLEELNLA